MNLCLKTSSSVWAAIIFLHSPRVVLFFAVAKAPSVAAVKMHNIHGDWNRYHVTG